MKKTLSIIVLVIIVAAGSFYAGLKYGQSKNQNTVRGLAGFFTSSESGNGQPRMQFFNGDGAGTVAGRALRANGGFASGEVLSKDDKSLTIKLRDGGSKIVFFSESTAVTKNASGSLAELKVGDAVTAVGTANQDGSITAQSIQLRPEPPTQPNE